MSQNRALLFFTTLLLFSIGLITLSYPTIKGVKYVEGVEKKINFPHKFSAKQDTNYNYKIVIASTLAIFNYRVIPDDCIRSITIDEKNIPLKGDIQKNRCNYSKGFVLESGLFAENTTMALTIKNNGGESGLNIKPIFPPLLYVPLAFSFVGLFWILARRSGLGYSLTLLFVAGFLFRFYYLGETPFDVRTHDVLGHIDYIKYIVNNFAIPGNMDCYQCYHPPLYYLVAALIFGSAWELGMNLALESVQFLSLLFMMGSLLFALLIIKEALRSFWLRFFSGVLLVFTPMIVIHSIRIGNDSLLYLLYFGALFFLVRWFKEHSNRDLYISALFAALSLLVKSNGIVIVGIILATLGFLFLKKVATGELNKKFFKTAGITTTIIAVGFLINFASSIYENIQNKRNSSVIVGNIDSVNSGLRVGNELDNFLYFDIKNFIEEPFTSAWDSKKGREYFLNYTFKTALFGEFDDFPNNQKRNLATAISAVFLLILFANLLWILSRNRSELYENLPIVLNLLLPLLALAYFRYLIPQSCSNDFRYILPMILSLIIFYAKSIEIATERGWFFSHLLMRISIPIFAISGVALFIP